MSSTSSSQTVAVLGATGQQGGATARRLLGAGRQVRAVTRDPSSPAARALADAGAEVVAANLDDPASLVAALAGAHGVFSVQPSPLSPGQPAGRGGADEVRRGRAVADAAQAAGVAHFVFASAGGAERDSGIPTAESKWAVEQHVAALGLPATVLRPVTFMENYTSFMLRDGALHTAVDPDLPEQLIAVEDIGAFAAIVFASPAEYVGRALELAGDELTAAQIADALGRAAGAEVPIVRVSPAAMREALGDYVGASLARAPAWLRGDGYRADIPALRALHPQLLDFERWLQNG